MSSAIIAEIKLQREIRKQQRLSKPIGLVFVEIESRYYRVTTITGRNQNLTNNFTKPVFKALYFKDIIYRNSKSSLVSHLKFNWSSLQKDYREMSTKYQQKSTV